jgi:hypothetical protein
MNTCFEEKHISAHSRANQINRCNCIVVWKIISLQAENLIPSGAPEYLMKEIKKVQLIFGFLVL